MPTTNELAKEVERLEGLLAFNMKLTTYLILKHFGTLDIDVVTRAVNDEIVQEQVREALRDEVSH